MHPSEMTTYYSPACGAGMLAVASSQICVVGGSNDYLGSTYDYLVNSADSVVARFIAPHVMDDPVQVYNRALISTVHIVADDY